MARTGLRMMPTFPSPSLQCRTAGFPQYGFKASLSGRACPADITVKPAPGMPAPSTSVPRPFARVCSGRTTWHGVQINPCLPVPLCERPVPLYPRGPWLRSGVVLSQTIIAYYDPIRRSRGHAGISRPSRLYPAPSLCGSASATRETFPTFPATLSIRAVDPTPVGPQPPSRCVGAAIPGFLVLRPSRHPRSPSLPAMPDGECFSARHRSRHAATRLCARPSWLTPTTWGPLRSHPAF